MSSAIRSRTNSTAFVTEAISSSRPGSDIVGIEFEQVVGDELAIGFESALQIELAQRGGEGIALGDRLASFVDGGEADDGIRRKANFGWLRSE